MSASSPTSASRWSRRKLAVVLFPFVAAAVAINLFLASLLGAVFGVPVLPPTLALLLSLPLGVPATWAVARWVDGLLDAAEDGS
ncbi:MAG: hypothetical protein KDK10_05330 [Maritimibacter sp.]|nr:hypothetical protein [Maritimibacter sp.]